MTPIFVVVGPPAVGKSTTSRALAARFAKSLHIRVDDIREMVVSGLRLPSANWSDELVEQISLARASVSHMALTYREAGFAVVIDDFADPNQHSDYQALLNQPEVHGILLYPSQSEAHQRNLRRSGDTPARAYIDEGIRLVYEQLDAVLPLRKQEGWHVLDTSLLSVEDTVMAIVQLSTT